MKRVVQDPSRYFREVSFDALKDMDPKRLLLIGAIAVE